MARSESDRHWSFGTSDFHFSHRFLSGRQFRIGGDFCYWNPEISNLLRDTHPDILLVAGAWIHPTILLASTSEIRTIFWSESHLNSIRRTGFFTGLARRWALSRFAEFAVPGQLAKEYIEHYSTAARIHSLANLVDPTDFHDEVERHRRAGKIGLSASKHKNRRVLLVVARLTEAKGLLPFLEGVERLNAETRSKFTVLVAGSGHLQTRIEDRIARRGLDVRLLGQQTQEQMAAVYAQADGFCLPSMSDPNPISVIEALWAALPLLISSRVGNHPECLEAGRNGFLFEPGNPESISYVILQWLALSHADLQLFGENSLRIAHSKFDPGTVISDFLASVLPEAVNSSENSLNSAIAAG